MKAIAVRSDTATHDALEVLPSPHGSYLAILERASGISPWEGQMDHG